MGSLECLAAGVAHEINNPNGFVSSNLYTLALYLDDLKIILDAYARLKQELSAVNADQPLPSTVMERCRAVNLLEKEIDLGYVLEDSRQLITESKEGTERIQKIVAEMTDFTNVGYDLCEEIDINETIEYALDLVWDEIKDKTEVVKGFSELPKVIGCSQIISKVFVNLIINAAQAMAARGKINIITRAQSNRVQIQIQDNGVGIPQEMLGRIYEPFYTTRQIGLGMGLGLSLVYTAVKNHGGEITVTSQVGVGTTVVIELPASAAENQGVALNSHCL